MEKGFFLTFWKEGLATESVGPFEQKEAESLCGQLQNAGASVTVTEGKWFYKEPKDSKELWDMIQTLEWLEIELPDSFTKEWIFPRLTCGEVFVDLEGVVYKDENMTIRKGIVNWDIAYCFVKKDDRIKNSPVIVFQTD